MVELKLYQNNSSTSAQYGMWYPRASYKETIDLDKLAKLLKTHNTHWSEGALVGILKDMVKEVREQTLNGNCVKIDDLAIFKCSVEANGMKLGENYKISAGLGGLPPTKNPDGTSRTPDYTKETQYAVKSVKLLAQATGEFTREELNGDATFRWTKAAKETIDAIVNPPTPEPEP